MKTTKFLFVIGLAAALGALVLTGNAKDTEEQARLREALRQRMATLEFPPVPAAVEDANTARLREALRQQMAVLDFPPVPPAVNDENTARLRQALRQQMAVFGVAPFNGTSSALTAPLAPQPPGMDAPLSPPTGSKAARLAELLRRYNLDQITPKEYHTQRATILAEP